MLKKQDCEREDQGEYEREEVLEERLLDELEHLAGLKIRNITDQKE